MRILVVRVRGRKPEFQGMLSRGAKLGINSVGPTERTFMSKKNRVTDEEALSYHLEPTPGKLEINASTPMATQRDLSLAYSPGVAVPVEAIAAKS